VFGGPPYFVDFPPSQLVRSRHNYDERVARHIRLRPRQAGLGLRLVKPSAPRGRCVRWGRGPWPAEKGPVSWSRPSLSWWSMIAASSES
jgi:hypothetical protein